MRNSCEIDFVIPWVDGFDKAWQMEKAKYSNGSEESRLKEATRYRDWDLLRYWFRGVEKYAPWVRKIHFVTWGHFPEWLNIDHPKLSIVNHRDYIPEQYLPTFSSHAIEVNIHRIPDLAENFVYFNDDTFLIRKTRKKDFFKKGLPRGSAVLVPFRTMKGDWLTAPLNNVAVINDHFPFHATIYKHFFKWLNFRYGVFNLLTAWMLPLPAFYGFYEFHLPSSFLKSTFYEVWDKEKDLLDKTTSHRFRDRADVNQWVFENWQFAKGSFAPRSPRIGRAFYLSGACDNTLEQLCSYIKKQKGSMVCVNDGEMSTKMFAMCQQKVKEAFCSHLNESCSFELK